MHKIEGISKKKMLPGHVVLQVGDAGLGLVQHSPVEVNAHAVHTNVVCSRKTNISLLDLKCKIRAISYILTP